MTISYTGDEVLSSDFTVGQAVAVEQWLRCAPGQWRGGLLRELSVELGDPPWTDAQLTSALFVVFQTNHSIDTPLIKPE